jgi:hypothetical protein
MKIPVFLGAETDGLRRLLRALHSIFKPLLGRQAGLP